jgi:hypothetical protein
MAEATTDDELLLTTSQLNLEGLIATIRDTNAYNAIVEAVSNAIHSIEDAKVEDGLITVELIRDAPKLGLSDDDSENNLPEITGIKVTDNGIGFNDDNIRFFNEAYTRHKVEIGGKGFGRFVYLKHFRNVHIVSIYEANDSLKQRTFELGRANQIVYDLATADAGKNDSRLTTIFLEGMKDDLLDKKIETVSRKLLDKLLVQFIRADTECPTIKVVDDYTGKEFILNNLLGDSSYSEIQKISAEEFVIGKGKKGHTFQLYIFKIWFAGHQQSKISLTSHYLEVTDTPVDEYVNEFESGFVGDLREKNGEKTNHFIIRAYVTGDYLDEHVDRERVKFQFGKNADAYYPLGRADIESEVANILKNKYESQFTTERQKKEERLSSVADEKPWLKRHTNDVDLAGLKVGAPTREYEVALETARIKKEQELDEYAENFVKSDAKQLADEKTEELIRDITQSNKDDLARYVARRKAVIDILDKSLKANQESEKHEKEKVLHDIVYPMQADSDHIGNEYQNLWLLDERLNFTEFISSDKKFSKGNPKRADLFIFHHQVAFRAGDDKQNPITIVEFKRPGRDDFAATGNPENPVDQLVRYTNAIREGKYQKPGKRPIYTDKNTQFYGFVVIDFTEKVKRWLHDEEDFDPMPDGLGYFKWKKNNNLYVEVISWDKLLKDAKLRNSIFAQKLGIQ